MRKPDLIPASHGSDTPLNHALQRRDSDTLKMVAEAVEHKQCMLAYQSIMVTSDTTRVGFYEGLIRVADETGRIIPANSFMPVVERSELGREIDRIALRLGLQTLNENPDIRLSINMSARSIGYEPWMKTLKYWLRRNSTIGERLILEITESSAIDQPEITLDFMTRISEYGICFALDDFGSGYTALKYLRDFYFDILKIDQSFCQGIAQDADNHALVSSMIDIARHFDMLTVAEGVESYDDVQTLTAMGIDCLQGFYFDAPTTRPVWTLRDTKRGKKRSTAA